MTPNLSPVKDDISGRFEPAELAYLNRTVKHRLFMRPSAESIRRPVRYETRPFGSVKSAVVTSNGPFRVCLSRSVASVSLLSFSFRFFDFISRPVPSSMAAVASSRGYRWRLLGLPSFSAILSTFLARPQFPAIEQKPSVA